MICKVDGIPQLRQALPDQYQRPIYLKIEQDCHTIHRWHEPLKHTLLMQVKQALDQKGSQYNPYPNLQGLL